MFTSMYNDIRSTFTLLKMPTGALDCFQTLKSVKTLLYMGMKHLCMFFPPQIEMCVSKTFNCQWWTVWSAKILKTAVNEESF